MVKYNQGQFGVLFCLTHAEFTTKLTRFCIGENRPKSGWEREFKQGFHVGFI